MAQSTFGHLLAYYYVPVEATYNDFIRLPRLRD